MQFITYTIDKQNFNINSWLVYSKIVLILHGICGNTATLDYPKKINLIFQPCILQFEMCLAKLSASFTTFYESSCQTTRLSIFLKWARKFSVVSSKGLELELVPLWHLWHLYRVLSYSLRLSSPMRRNDPASKNYIYIYRPNGLGRWTQCRRCCHRWNDQIFSKQIWQF